MQENAEEINSSEGHQEEETEVINDIGQSGHTNIEETNSTEVKQQKEDCAHTNVEATTSTEVKQEKEAHYAHTNVESSQITNEAECTREVRGH